MPEDVAAASVAETAALSTPPSPAPSEGKVKLTEDQILPDEEGSASAEGQEDGTSEAKAVPEGEEKSGEEEKPKGETAEAEPGVEGKPVSQAIKDVWKAHPEIKEEHYQLEAYRELFGINEARRLREVFSGDLTDVGQVLEDARTLWNFADVLKADPKEFIGKLAEVAPEEYPRLIASLRDSVSDKEWAENFSKPAVARWLGWHKEAAREAGDEAWVEAVAVLEEKESEALGRRPARSRIPEDDPRLKELDELKRRDAERAVHDDRSFRWKVETGFSNLLQEEVGKSVQEAVKGLHYPEKRVERISRDVMQRIGAAIRDNPLAVRIMQAYLGSPDKSDQKANELVRALVNRAKTYLGPVKKDVLSEWLDEDSKASHVREEKATEAAARKDVGAGAPGPAAPRKYITKADMKRMHLDEDQILEQGLVLRR